MITTLTGQNNFLLNQAKRTRINEYLERSGDFGLEQYDGESSEPGSIYDALTNLPFLIDKKLVVINQPGNNKQLAEKLPDWLENPDEAIEVLIVEPSPDKRTVWYKFLQKSTNLIDFKSLDENSLRRWIREFVSEQQGTITAPAINRLLELLPPGQQREYDQQQIYQELSKLLAYSPDVTLEAVEQLVEPLPQDTIFSMLDALGQGDMKKTYQLYDSLRQGGVNAAEILSMVGWQLHTLALIKSVRDGDVASVTGLHPYVVRKNQSLTRRLSLGQLKEMVDATYQTELSIKRRGIDAHEVVGLLLVRLGQKVI